ncbi:MAG TPA: DUF418 domain-containing protein [Phycisphaerales bacterium]|nr:DUF418 domain-containing protein [Phycisphaerales bacterium]
MHPEPLYPATAAFVPPRRGRIAALDTTRGLALLGIMLVNVHYFTDSFATFYSTAPKPSGGPVPLWLDEAAYFFSRAFCEGKFFPLYSLLFGAGMVLILEKVAREGGRFWAVYLRRLLVLGVIGLCHGFLLWFGDILFVYSLLGVALLLLGPYCPGRVLCILGGCLIAVGMVLTLGCLSLQMLGGAPPAPQPLAESITSLPPGERMFKMMAELRGNAMLHPAWAESEREAYTQGPFLQALIVRSMSYVFSVMAGLMMMGPTIGGMFLLGAGLMKEAFWSGEPARLRRWFLLIGLGLGLPACIIGVLVARLASGNTAHLGLALAMAFGPLLTLGIAAAVIAWACSGKAARLARLIAVPGRMGLTCYLLTTVLMTFISYHWGLALWGTFGSAEQVGLCLVVYTVLIAFSHLWMSRFSVGPVEWVWKSLSYLRVTPIRREPAQA